MATTKPRKKKTAADYKRDAEKAKKKAAELEAKAYEGELIEAIAATTIVAQFQSLKAKHPNIPPINIFRAIGKATKIMRLSVTQSEPQKRAPKKTTTKK